MMEENGKLKISELVTIKTTDILLIFKNIRFQTSIEYGLDQVCKN